MSNDLENKESLDDIRQALGAIITEQMVQQTEVTQQQNAAIAESVLKLTKEGDRGGGTTLDYFTRGELSDVKRPSVKLDFPRFAGVEPEGWLYQANEYFAYHGIDDESKVQIAGFHMTDKALKWIRGLRRNKLLTTWNQFMEDFRERFGRTEYKNKLEDLSRLQQTSTVEEYLEKFEKLLNDVAGQSEHTLITYFVGVSNRN